MRGTRRKRRARSSRAAQDRSEHRVSPTSSASWLSVCLLSLGVVMCRSDLLLCGECRFDGRCDGVLEWLEFIFDQAHALLELKANSLGRQLVQLRDSTAATQHSTAAAAHNTAVAAGKVSRCRPRSACALFPQLPPLSFHPRLRSCWLVAAAAYLFVLILQDERDLGLQLRLRQ